MEFDFRSPPEQHIRSYRVPANTFVRTIVEQLEAGFIDGSSAIADDAAVQRFELACVSFDATDNDCGESIMASDSPLENWTLRDGAITMLVPLRRVTPT